MDYPNRLGIELDLALKPGLDYIDTLPQTNIISEQMGRMSLVKDAKLMRTLICNDYERLSEELWQAILDFIFWYGRHRKVEMTQAYYNIWVQNVTLILKRIKQERLNHTQRYVA